MKLSPSPLLETFVYIVLVALGILGVALEAAHLFGWDFGLEPLHLVIGCLSFVMFAIGLERVVYIRRYDELFDYTREQLVAFRSELQERSDCIHVRTRKEVYASAERLVREAQSRIQTVIFGPPKAPQEYVRAVTTRLRESRKAGSPIKFETVIAADYAHLPSGFKESFEKRRAQYTAEGVGDLSTLYLLNMTPPLGIDVLVVDRRHAALALSTHEGTGHVDHGLIFYNQPAIAAALGDWLEECFKGKAKRYEDGSVIAAQ